MSDGMSTHENPAFTLALYHPHEPLIVHMDPALSTSPLLSLLCAASPHRAPHLTCRAFSAPRHPLGPLTILLAPLPSTRSLTVHLAPSLSARPPYHLLNPLTIHLTPLPSICPPYHPLPPYHPYAPLTIHFPLTNHLPPHRLPLGSEQDLRGVDLLGDHRGGGHDFVLLLRARQAVQPRAQSRDRQA
eukprot:1191153-Prorocentrum_minimum.AAC.1